MIIYLYVLIYRFATLYCECTSVRHRNVNDPKFTQKFHQIFIIERANNIKIEKKKFISYIEIHVQNAFTIVRIVFITMSAELVCAKLSQIF